MQTYKVKTPMLEVRTANNTYKIKDYSDMELIDIQIERDFFIKQFIHLNLIYGHLINIAVPKESESINSIALRYEMILRYINETTNGQI